MGITQSSRVRIWDKPMVVIYLLWIRSSGWLGQKIFSLGKISVFKEFLVNGLFHNIYVWLYFLYVYFCSLRSTPWQSICKKVTHRMSAVSSPFEIASSFMYSKVMMWTSDGPRWGATHQHICPEIKTWNLVHNHKNLVGERWMHREGRGKNVLLKEPKHA